ncbi:hypothetical protein [Sorangium cellulosum]|uniref:hypothetical protein n=1 Tax=Sorangium cellulosum TaxID=56 RepID=UPI0010136CDF|nr:hypothetical protein [Sorangium cellulosum]
MLFTIVGCSQGVCRGVGSAPGTAGPAGMVTSPGQAEVDAGAAEAGAAAQPDGAEQAALDEQLGPLRKGGRHVVAAPPDDAEARSYGAWVAAAARAAQERQAPPAAPAGFALRVLPGRDLWVLFEDGARRRGAVAVVLRVGPAAPLLVEAPHTFFDQGTLPLALAVFEAQRARALLINTSHRYGGRPRPGSGAPDEEGGAEGETTNEGGGGGGGGPRAVGDAGQDGGSGARAAADAKQDGGSGARAAADAKQDGGSGARAAADAKQDGRRAARAKGGGARAAGGGARTAGGGARAAGQGAQADGGGTREESVEARARAAAALAFADVAHAERSFFLSAHRALLQGFPGMPTVQLHGFQDSSAPDAAVIGSAVGQGADLDRLLDPLRAVLRDGKVQGKVLAFPADIDKLGGATNVQARWSRQVGAPFYHLELSRSLRDELIEDADLRRRFAGAFAQVAAGASRTGGAGCASNEAR